MPSYSTMVGGILKTHGGSRKRVVYFSQKLGDICENSQVTDCITVQRNYGNSNASIHIIARNVLFIIEFIHILSTKGNCGNKYL